MEFVNLAEVLKTAKDNIIFCVEGLHENRLVDVPYRVYNDMAMTYRIRLEKENATIRINEVVMEVLGMDEPTLYKLATENTPRLMPAQFKTMTEIYNEMQGIDFNSSFGSEIEIDMTDVQEVPMYVLTNEQKLFGANALFYPGIQEEIFKKLHSEYYVLPSSIHETIIVPKSENINARDLQEMVQEVNHTQVPLNEILTGSVYEYDALAKTLTIANDPLYKANMIDIKRSGFKLTRKLVKNMESLNKATKRNNTIKDVKNILKDNNAPETVKDIAKNIEKECKMQEQAMLPPEV